MKELDQRVYDLLADLFQMESGSIDSNIVLDEVPNMDSLFFLEMVSTLEKEFGIRFDLEEVIEAKSVGDFLIIIKGCLNR
jgi:acyl carrier protein